MTPCYRCNYVVKGHSANKGDFEEEGTASIRRVNADVRTEASLRAEFSQDALDAFHKVTQWKGNPKYTEVTDLQVVLGEIETIGDVTV